MKHCDRYHINYKQTKNDYLIREDKLNSLLKRIKKVSTGFESDNSGKIIDGKGKNE
jgi:hypothetical protein